MAGARIYHLHPLLAGRPDRWGRHLARVADMGFSHVLLAPPFLPGQTGNVFVPADYDRLHPALGDGDATAALAAVADAASAQGLRVLLDVVIDRVAIGSVLARALAVDGDAVDLPPDPRPDASCQGAATVRFDAPDQAALAWWQARLARWLDAGVAGFRCCGAARVAPGIWTALIASARGAHPDAIFIAWLEQVDHDGASRLASCGFDLASSSSWAWDMRADWLDADTRQVAAIGEVLAMPELPFGPRLAASGPQTEALCRRAIRFAGAFGASWLMPMGLEFMARRKLDPVYDTEAAFAGLADSPEHDLSGLVRSVNAAHAARQRRAWARLVSGPGAATAALLEPEEERLILVNASCARTAPLRLGTLLPRLGGLDIDAPMDVADLAPGELRVVPLHSPPPILLPQPSVQAATHAPRIAIEAIAPAVDAGRFPAKRILGETVEVSADIICDGHDKLSAVLLWRTADMRDWTEVAMVPGPNDRWTAVFPLGRLGRHEFTIEAWKDTLGGFREDLAKKRAAGQDVSLELIEEAALAERGEVRDFAVCHVPVLSVDAERSGAGYASWYELFPRSMSFTQDRHGHFDDVIAQLPYVRDMGFDVLYFPPIHPIGRKNRKGPNNTLTPGPNDPGSPYAIGAAEGGHEAIHPELGSFDDFRRLLQEARAHGLEIALDFAIQCAPDHPWLRDHPDWFDWRPDGTVKYAENPPKKYQDIVNVAFYAEGAMPALWLALRDIVALWVREGIRIFRVDNPHTKPLPFWEWMIADIRSRHPEVIFLAEAFTRPKMMYRLAKAGFSQSYTYFTWRNTAAELREYLTELTTTAPREFFRPHFFVNTPDINPVFLHNSGRPGFLLRAALAATLSGLWGVYSGFELCEAASLNGREEYLDSEKYQIRVWNRDRPDNIIAEIRQLNHIRRTNPALHSHLGVRFLPCSNDRMLCFVKASAEGDNLLVIAISLDPFAPQEGDFEVSPASLGLEADTDLRAEDLIAGGHAPWRTGWRRLRLDPTVLPYALWRVRPIAEG
jgi:starch synthase (maltosyl-transferring)